MILAEYECTDHGRFEVIEDHEAQDTRPCPECGNASAWCFPAPSIKPNYASVTQGKRERPAGFLSTEAIADGMSTSEYKAKLGERRKERIRAHVRSKI